MTGKLMKRLNNRYFYAALVFFVWILFFDKNSLISRFQRWSELNDAKKQKEYYLEQIEKDKESIHQLMTDSSQLERFAREQYLMKRDNEDVFVIVEEQEEE